MTQTKDEPIDPEDPYRWLEANETPRVQDWLKAQSEQSEQYFQAQPMRQALRDRFRQLFSLDTVVMPYPFEGKYFHTKRLGDQDLAVLYVRGGLGGEPRVVLDPNTLSDDKSVTLSGWAPSDDGNLLAYELSSAGNDKTSINIMDVRTGEKLPDVIPDHYYPSFDAWNQDGTGFWYSKHDPAALMEEAKLHKRLYFHTLGTAWQDDPIVFNLPMGKEETINGGPSDDGRYFLVQRYGQDEATGREWNEAWLRDLGDPNSDFVCVIERNPGTEFIAEFHRDKLYVATNQDAPLRQIMEMDIAQALAGNPTPMVLVPEGRGVIEEKTFVGDKLFVLTLEDVHSILRQYDLDGHLVREIVLPDLGSASGMACEAEGSELFFSFASYAVPPTTFRLDLASGDLAVFDQMKAGFDTDQIKTEQVWYPSKDGTQIPMFLIHRKDLKLDDNNPTVLYGYGGFDISLTPAFTKSIVPFIERGGVYAIANLRGGGEFGKAWHEAGMRKNKQNVFDDFAAAARWLVGNGYTRKERLAISGGSNGGLLTLTTITQQPNLVAAAIADMPVADMLRFHIHFGGVYWIPDYGDPDDPDMREYLQNYSPYHNVCDGGHYPATLIATADGDDRVHPMHSYKMAARLQEANASANPIILRVELKAGHAGASAISKMVEDLADEWSFLFDRLGVAW